MSKPSAKQAEIKQDSKVDPKLDAKTDPKNSKQDPKQADPKKDANELKKDPSKKGLEVSKVLDPKADLKNNNSMKIEQTPAKPRENVLISSGILDAYDYLQKSICKHGFPKGNVFDYAALQILKYERKLKAEKAKKLELIRNARDVKESVAHEIMEKSKSPEKKSDKHLRDSVDEKGKKDDKAKKDAKDVKDVKDAKDGKDAKDKKDGKDGKDIKDAKDQKKDDGKKDGKKDDKKDDKKDQGGANQAQGKDATKAAKK